MVGSSVLDQNDVAHGMKAAGLAARPLRHRSSWSPIEIEQAAANIEGTMATVSEVKHRLFLVVLIIAIVIAMAGWAYALGWVALTLIHYI